MFYKPITQVERNNVVKGVPGAGAGAPGVPAPLEARQQGVQAREAGEPAEGAVPAAGAGEVKKRKSKHANPQVQAPALPSRWRPRPTAVVSAGSRHPVG